MGNISTVIITKNEEKNIERCLRSLAGVTDEIIVVDSYSTDQTENICKRFGVRFVKREFVDYSSSKNYGNSLANFPFILSIDADEVLSDQLKQSILSVKTRLKGDGYEFNRKTNYCGQWINYSGWYPDKKIRLFDKTKAKWQGEVHEELVLSGGQVQFLEGDLLHYSYPTISSHLEKINLYTDKMAKVAFEKNKKASLLSLFFAPTIEFFKRYFIKCCE